MAARLFRRLDHIFPGGVQPAEFDVVFNGILKKINILEHNGKIFQQTVAGKIFYIMSAHTDFPFLHIPKTGNEAYKGRFAGAGRPYDGAGCFFRNDRAYILQHIFLSVGKGNVGKLNVIVIQWNIPAMFIQYRRIHNGLHTVQGGIDDTGNGGHTSH